MKTRKTMRLLRVVAATLWRNTDNLTKWIQVLALCIAAWWTFTNYSVADKPSLEPNVDVTSRFSVAGGWEPNTCRVQYTVAVKNEGKVSFDVTQVHFRAWHSNLPNATPQEATFLDADNFETGNQIIDQPITSAY